jgi:DNA primase
VATWINFKELRDRLNATDILAMCNVSVKVKGDQAQGFCPLPTHPKHDGKRRSPSFSVNLKRGIWQCFSCRASGNLIDLVCRLQGMDPGNPGDVRKAALMLDEKFPGTGTSQPAPPRMAKSSSARQAVETARAEGKVIVNGALDFELKQIDPKHPYLSNLGFTSGTIAHFKLGFCSKGIMKDRIVIPLHDAAGRLVGYAGRVVDNALIDEENPRYRFPSGREKDQVRYDFQKSLFLYNGYAVGDDLEELTVVESFTATWWLFQHSIPLTVAVMGSSCSREQGALIVAKTKPDALITILTDGDDAGIQCAHSIFTEVAPHRAVKWAKLDSGKQPTDLSANELNVLLGNRDER